MVEAFFKADPTPTNHPENPWKKVFVLRNRYANNITMSVAYNCGLIRIKWSKDLSHLKILCSHLSTLCPPTLISIYLIYSVVSRVMWMDVTWWMVYPSAAVTQVPLDPASSTNWPITRPTTTMSTKLRTSTSSSVAAGKLWLATTWA